MRRIAREFALKFLFPLQLPIFSNEKDELKSNLDDKAITKQFEELAPSLGEKISSADLAFSLSLIKGVIKNLDELENKLKKYVKGSAKNRMSYTESVILILAFYELLYDKKAPAVVVIDEAIELGKIYGSEHSPGLINAILDNVRKTELENAND